MKVIAPDDFSFVTPLGRPVDKGEEVEVDEEVGTQLVAQGWDSARAKAARRTARKRRRAHAEDSTPETDDPGDIEPEDAPPADENVMPPASEEV